MKTAWMEAFGRMTYGIYVLTSGHRGAVNGMIASWVSQVSYAPPLILAAVHPDRFSHALVEKSGCFALHVIARSQKNLMDRFKGPDPREKFSGIAWTPGRNGCPVLGECLAWFECRVTESLRPGNHTLYVGEVVDASPGAEGTPLCTLDYEGRYTGRV